MIAFYATLAGIAATAGASLLYLASPNQRLRAHRLTGRWPQMLGWGLILCALLLLWQFAGSASGIFILFTLLMAIWSLPPLAIAWLRARKDAQG